MVSKSGDIKRYSNFKINNFYVKNDSDDPVAERTYIQFVDLFSKPK